MYSILIERKRNEPEDEDARYPRWKFARSSIRWKKREREKGKRKERKGKRR